MTITTRENMIRVFNHEEPEFMPLITDIQDISTVEPGFACDIQGTREPGMREVDWFGQPWLLEPGINAYNPDVNNYIIKDIAHWEEYLIIPNLEQINWEEKFKKDAIAVDRENKFIQIKDRVGLWERAFCTVPIVDLLCALLEEPEACERFFSAIADHKIKLHNYYLEYYRPDSLCMHDDFGSGTSLFMSPGTWRALIKPHLQRVIDNLSRQGVKYNHHCCGVLAPIAEEIADMGAVAWENVHVSNDPCACKQSFGNKLAFIGGLANNQFLDLDSTTEEQVREHMRQTMDQFLPGVGSVVCSGFKAHPERRKIVDEELLGYGQTFFASKRPQ